MGLLYEWLMSLKVVYPRTKEGGWGRGEEKQYSNRLLRYTRTGQGVASSGTGILNDLLGNDLGCS